MRLSYFASRGLRSIVVLLVLGGLGATILPARAGGPALWRTLFPTVAAYPVGTRLLPVQTSRQADVLLDRVTAAQVSRLGFVVGGIQDVILPRRVVVSVRVLSFGTARGAALFLRHDHPAELAHPATAGTPIGGMGDGARYLAGDCAACGSGAAPLGILILRRGAAVVQILTQPTDHALALHLGRAVLHP